MAARKNREHKIALFPFLSVLICTIGVLTLILISSVLGQVDAVVDTAEKYEGIVRQLDKVNSQVEQWQTSIDRKQEQLEKLAKELDELEKLLGELGLVKAGEYHGIFNALKEARKNIKNARDAIDKVELKIQAADPDGKYRGKAPPDALKELTGLRVKLNAIERERDDAEARIGRLNQDQEGLDQELDLTKKALEQADPKGKFRNTPDATPNRVADMQKELADTTAANQKLAPALAGLDQKIKAAKKQLNQHKVDPKLKVAGGTGTGFEPRYIECTKNGLIIHPVRKVGHILDPKRFNADKQKFIKYLDSVNEENRRRRKAKRQAKDEAFVADTPEKRQAAEKKLKAIRELHVVMLIRPSGVENFNIAQSLAKKAKIKPGFLPIPTDDQELDLDTDDE